MFNDMLNDAVENPVGTKFKKDNVPFVQFYDMIYFDFGLTSKHRLQVNERVPVDVSVGFDGKPYYFEIRGNIHHPSLFLAQGGVLERIARETPLSRNKVWAFDITRLNEGVLAGRAVFSTDDAYVKSEESLKILRIINGAIRVPFSHVPGVTLEFDYMWNRFGIPDKIHFIVGSMYPFKDENFLEVVKLIQHNYRNYNVPVKFAYSGNPATGMMSITAEENLPEPETVPEIPVSLPEFMKDLDEFMAAAKAAQTPDNEDASGDGFPYDFYRGIGLIDAEDHVSVPSVVGPIRLHMTHDSAKEYLLAYNPDN
jgi:hypothetical protein